MQTNEDALDQEVQTDDIDVEAKWCQFSNDVQASGGDLWLCLSLLLCFV